MKIPPTPLSLKQFQVDRLRDRLVAGIVGMEVVAAVEGGRNRGRMGRIGDNGIEINDRVKGPTGPDPVIDGLALRLLVGRKITDIGTVREGIFERRQRT